ncbi:MAG: M48 family metalloprotease, partial [Actinocatenispora sp.]
RSPTRPARAAQLAALRDLPADEVDRGRALHAQLRPVRYAALLVELVVAALLGLTPLAAHIVAAVGRATGGHRLLTAVLGGLVVGAIGTLVGLPFTARRRTLLRRYGLLTQGFAGWLADLGRGAALAVLFGGAVLAGFFALTGALPHLWWLPVAVGGAALTVLLSLVFPVLVEPLFNRFTPMPDSPLRADLLALAAADQVPVRTVLVADASKRGRAVNAYVSGFGPTRRVVVFDTLLSAAPEPEVRLVVAHELGHARYRDVVLGTALGAAGAAAGACLLYLLGAWHGLLGLAGVAGFGDPRSIGLLLLVMTVAQLVAGPAGNLVSRRIEARADAHALASTGEADTFVAMQRRLALRNLADVDPHRVEHLLFDSHPSTVERIAAARGGVAGAGASGP